MPGGLDLTVLREDGRRNGCEVLCQRQTTSVGISAVYMEYTLRAWFGLRVGR